MESEIHRLVEQANEPKTTEVHSGGSPGGGGPGAMKNMAKKDLAWWSNPVLSDIHLVFKKKIGS